MLSCSRSTPQARRPHAQCELPAQICELTLDREGFRQGLPVETFEMLHSFDAPAAGLREPIAKRFAHECPISLAHYLDTPPAAHESRPQHGKLLLTGAQLSLEPSHAVNGTTEAGMLRESETKCVQKVCKKHGNVTQRKRPSLLYSHF